MEYKQCPMCNETKSLDQFYIRRKGRVGRPTSYCKTCHADRAKKDRECSPDSDKMVKLCTMCGIVKPWVDFHKHRAGECKGSPTAYCKACTYENRKAYRETHRESERIASNKYKSSHQDQVRAYTASRREITALANKVRIVKARGEILDFFGHECEICGENLVEFLTIDHIAGNGAGSRDRRAGHSPGWVGIWNVCKKQGWDNSLYDIYRILCFNCNCSRDRRPNPCQNLNASLCASKISEVFYV